jgi:methyl-accepting chemotaxis protein
MNFDFMAAKLKHSMWKMHLRDFLDGKPGLTAAQATSHRDCDLGQWLYTEGLTKYGAIPEMKLLVAKHEELHRVVKQIMDHKAAGNKAEAETQYARIDPISKQLTELLTAVERGVALKAW